MIVLDTRAWIGWLTKPARLGKKATRAIERSTRVGIPAISVWEVAIKAQSGKLRFDRPVDVWIDEAWPMIRLTERLPLSPRIAVGAARLSWDHGDPADRFIVATARSLEAHLVTGDERIRKSGLVRCVWD